MFGIGKRGLQVFEQNGKYGVGTKREFVPQYSFDSEQEAKAFIAEHGAEMLAENGE